jgi:hypothetical protein
MSEGKTLAAVKHIKDLLEQDNKVKIVSNITLYNLKYKPFKMTGFLKYRNKVVFLDMFDFFMDWGTYTRSGIMHKRRGITREKLERFFANNNKLLVTMQNTRWFCPVIAEKITLALGCSMDKDGNIKVRDSSGSKHCVIKDKEEYYKFYNTFETLNFRKKQIKKEV